jgi:hypothetical protein
MSDAKPIQRIAWMPPAALAIAVGISLGLLVSPLLKSLEFGDSAIKVSAGFLKPGQGFDTEPSGFISTGWDGPIGEFSHGNIYGLKIGKWMYRIDVVTEPLVRAREKLPATIPGLVEALNSKEPFVQNAAAQKLSQLGVIVQDSPTGYVVPSENTGATNKSKVME